jgi:serine/threonine protein kinase
MLTLSTMLYHTPFYTITRCDVQVKLADFGFSTVIDQHSTAANNSSSSSSSQATYGTADFMSPEAVRIDTVYTTSTNY